MIAHACFWWLASRPQRSELPELTRLLVRFDHVAHFIENADHNQPAVPPRILLG